MHAFFVRIAPVSDLTHTTTQMSELKESKRELTTAVASKGEGSKKKSKGTKKKNNGASMGGNNDEAKGKGKAKENSEVQEDVRLPPKACILQFDSLSVHRTQVGLADPSNPSLALLLSHLIITTCV